MDQTWSHLAIGVVLLLLGQLGGLQFAFAKDSHVDVCDGEALRLECGPGQVLLIQSAVYGRMALSKCVQSDFYLGCQQSVLSVMDTTCSGYHRCEIPTISKRTFDLEDSSGGCPTEVYSYLSLSYTCVHALDLRSACSSSPSALFLRQPEAIIHVSSIQSLPCRSVPFSFQMMASPGQQINLTLINIGPENSIDLGCYGEVIEGRTGQVVRVCPGSKRYQHLIVSNSELVIVQLNEVASNFILSYNVIGCTDPYVPLGGWMERSGDIIEAGCHGDAHTWQLKCLHNINQWQGMHRNCSQAADIAVKKTPSQTTVLPISPDIIIALIISSAIIICIVTVTVGIVCWKKKSTQSLQSAVSAQKIVYRPVIQNDSPESGYMTSDRRTLEPTEEGIYDFCFTPGVPPVGQVRYQRNNSVSDSRTLPPACPVYATRPLPRPSDDLAQPPSSPLYKTLVFNNELS